MHIGLIQHYSEDTSDFRYNLQRAHFRYAGFNRDGLRGYFRCGGRGLCNRQQDGQHYFIVSCFIFRFVAVVGKFGRPIFVGRKRCAVQSRRCYGCFSALIVKILFVPKTDIVNPKGRLVFNASLLSEFCCAVVSRVAPQSEFLRFSRYLFIRRWVLWGRGGSLCRFFSV